MKRVCAEDVCLDVEAVERKGGGVCYLCVLRPPPPHTGDLITMRARQAYGV